MGAPLARAIAFGNGWRRFLHFCANARLPTMHRLAFTQAPMIIPSLDAARTARALVATDAVRIAADTPFFYTSGWASPVYVDAHALLCDVAWRTELMDAAARAVAPLVAQRGIGAVVGSESSGIAFAAWLADRLALPMLYLRKRPIGWGVQAQLQGRLPQDGSHVLLVDDVTTDGRSKMAAATALRQTGTQVSDALVLFDYAIYPDTSERLAQHALQLHALASWPHLHAALLDAGHLSAQQRQTLADFTASPTQWSLAHGGTGAAPAGAAA